MDETFTYENSFQHRYEKVGKIILLFQECKAQFESDDLTLVNLETTFTKLKKGKQEVQIQRP